MGIGAGKVALDHRLDVELAHLMPVAVAMNPHHPDAAFSVAVLDQRHVRASGSTGEPGHFALPVSPIMSNVRAIEQVFGASFWSKLWGRLLARPLYRSDGARRPERSR